VIDQCYCAASNICLMLDLKRFFSSTATWQKVGGGGLMSLEVFSFFGGFAVGGWR
jgi:hypothetical protein